MPHVIRAGRIDLRAAWSALPVGPWRWGQAIGRVEGCYLAREEKALLVAGVVVEYGRPLHPVVLITHQGANTAFHLWPNAQVERTDAVKRLLAEVARSATQLGCAEILQTNLTEYLHDNQAATTS